MRELIGKCPACGDGAVYLGEGHYLCDKCKFSLRSEMAKHVITMPEIRAILSGQVTEQIFFMSKSGKPFKARLYFEPCEKRVKFLFPENDNARYAGKSMKETAAYIRLEAEASGIATFEIRCGGWTARRSICYGNVSSREAECLAGISAIKLLVWHSKACDKLDLCLSINNLEFIKYVLRELIPRNKRIRYIVDYFLDLLSKFNSWKASYEHKKRQRLEGGNRGQYPRGAFPWLSLDIAEEGGKIHVELPDSPDVITQFLASFSNARRTDETNKIVLPVEDRSKVNEWLCSVRES